jgi:DNA polymerase-2
LETEGIPCYEADEKPKDAYLIDLGTKGGIEIHGEPRPGKRVDLVFSDPELRPTELKPVLSWAAIDIETSREGEIRATSIAWGKESSQAFLLSPEAHARGEGSDEVLCFKSEADLLRAFSKKIVELDPDVLSGWNVIEFDFRILSRRFAALGLPFDMGRSADASRYLEGSDGASSAVIIPGRQVLDSMRIARSGPERFEDLSLETVSRAVLGEGKSVSLKGEEKLAELDRQYARAPMEFARYCARDSSLVLSILEKTGLRELTQARSALTGVSLDRAWTSIPAFERLYAGGLRERGIAIPRAPEIKDYGSPGGLILEPSPGIFRNVLVLDFKSLYPTVIRSFNIDPLAHARSGGPDDIVAPNGARFSREPGILPQAIAEYFSRREKARAAGDGIAVYVYKILMNSFYGVLGAENCRYARSALAGAVTSFGQKYLNWTKSWAEGRGYRVLYGDTDSVFLKAPDKAAAIDLNDMGKALVDSLNADLSRAVAREYGLESFLEIKTEKIYDRFYLPRVRVSREDGEARGRAKGYAGRLADTLAVEVKGMEAVRSDWTPFARSFQMELLAMVFEDRDPALIKEWVNGRLKEILSGRVDGELVFARVLRRAPDDYLKNEPPPVKAARLLGWTRKRGRVEYLITTDGPQPLSLRTSPIDYDYYLDKQVLPMVRSVKETTGLDIVPSDPGSSQMELDFRA